MLVKNSKINLIQAKLEFFARFSIFLRLNSKKVKKMMKK